MKKNRGLEIIKMPIDPEEEKIFHWVESEECLGSKLLETNATITDQVKYELCRNIVRYKVLNEISLTEITNRLELDEASANRLLHYHLENFALSDLLTYVEKLHLPLKVKVGVANLSKTAI
jgi:hypothetical protein